MNGSSGLLARRLSLAILSGTAAFSATPAAASEQNPAGDLDVIAGIYMVAFLLYMIPTFIAFLRGHPNRWVIVVINVVFGGTGIGWLGSLVWAFSAIHRSHTGNHGGESGLNLFVNDPQLVKVEPNTAAQISDRLLRLKNLRDEGAISPEEYVRLERSLGQAP